MDGKGRATDNANIEKCEASQKASHSNTEENYSSKLNH